jgi:hypothetical protein
VNPFKISLKSYRLESGPNEILPLLGRVRGRARVARVLHRLRCGRPLYRARTSRGGRTRAAERAAAASAPISAVLHL